MALSNPRNTERRGPILHQDEFQADTNVVLHQGALVVVKNNGFLAPGSAATTHRKAGVLSLDDGSRKLDMTGLTAGSKSAKVMFGVFKFKNSSAGDLIAQADVGANCFIVDDEQVAKTDGTGTRSVAGQIWAVDSTGVWVRFAV